MADEYEIGSEPVEGTYKLGAPLDRDPRTDAPAPLPQAVRDRQARGQAFIDSVKANVKEHFSEPLGMSDERAQQWREHGILSDPATGRPGLLPPEDEAAFRLLTKAGDAALRGIGVALGVAGQAAGVVAGEFGAPDSERLGREISGELERRTILGEPLLRLAHTPDGPTKQPIGTAPADADFKIAAENIGGPHTEAKLRDLWDQRGIHPAEAAHDAGNDSFLKSQLTSPEQSITDRSGIPHPIGSPVPEGTPRAELAKTGDQLIDRLLDVPDLQKAINDPVPTLYPNKDFPKTMTVDGVTFDTADPAAVHANIQQYAVDALKAGGMDPATALKVGFWDFAEKAEDAFYKAHGIDPASVAKDSAIDKPTAAESARARQIMQDHLDEEEGITQPITRFKRSVANDRFGEEGSIVTHEISPMATTSQGMFGATFSPSSAGKFVARIVGDNGNTGILASNKKVFLENPEKPALFDTREEAEQAARQALGAQEVEQPLRAVGAEVTGKLPDLTQQPPLPPGRLADAGRKAVDQITGLAQNIQYLLDPMATGSKAAMVIAKDAINSVRRIRWEHAQRDANLVRNFDREKLERMWNAADEESVAAQLGESREHQGLVTLTAEERAAVEQLQADSQAAWLHAIDSGMVEGEGLPAYTPRMVLNVAAASEHAGPQALNELGRNVFTRVSQMKHRKYMMAEETEAAAKELVARRLAERGASPAEIAEATAKVAIARNIRALPLATAKLKEAAIWHDMIRKIEDVGKGAGQETVAEFNPGGGWFTIAGNPAFTRWRPALERNPETGKWGARTDDSGRPLMVPQPIYMAPEFKGPMRAILDESASKSKVAQGANSLYGALMGLKGRSMQIILNSPLIHNAVVWSKVAEAAGGRDYLGFGLYFRGNRLVNSNTARASQLIERGLSPMGPRGSFQDISGIMENPDVLHGYHQSWTGKVLGFVPGLFDPAAGQAVERAISTAGNFWHNTLLWDRVRDLQFGLADHLSDRLVAKGTDRLTADRIASHFSNLVVGSLPKEAMSSAARATSNMLMFSRSFTLGNLAVYKQAAAGLPKPILAQIERDFGIQAEAAIPEAAQATINQSANAIARRKAASTLLLSVGYYYAGNALLQNAFNIMSRDSSLDEEMKGYARRYEAFMKDVSKDPFELRHMVGRLSPVYDNEPQKQDRVYIGDTKDGTALYARNPVGKYGEEVVGYPTHPLTMLRQKLSPMAGGLLDVLENDKGFGKKIYDENDTSAAGVAASMFAVAKHLVSKQLPEGQLSAAVDLMHGEGDTKLNALRVFGPAAGFTVSQGAPGGMARGEQLAAKTAFENRFNIAWPDIRKQIQRGDFSGATDAMNSIGVPLAMQRGLMRSATNPAGQLKGRTLRDFYQYATPEQIQRFEGARGRTQPAPTTPLPPPPLHEGENVGLGIRG